MNQFFKSNTVVRAIDIACPLAKAFDFLNDAPQWLPWALPEVESVLPLPYGQWLVKTPAGLAKLRTYYDDAQGAAHCELLSAAAKRVPVQVVLTPTGCHLAITFTKPKQLNFEAFKTNVQHADEELHILKLMLEQD
ncbi:MAG: hypothetical protein ACRYFK_17070 [Janthinobacterium lividum]